ncbi:MAG: PilN domain-containing protein [Dictyoglomaceae bacterium]|nr:PilN domain-containing protein [Dictyoglomaceae bacterium]
MFRINLLPKVIKRKEVIRLPFLGILFFIVLLIVLLGGLTLYRNIVIEVKNLRNENLSLEQQISTIKDRLRELQKIEELKKQYSEKLKLLDEISQREISWLSLFENLNKNTPKNLWLKNFSMEDLNLNLEGFALSYNDIAVFLAQLESLGMLENVKLAFASRVGNPPYDSINFQLSAQYKRVEE